MQTTITTLAVLGAGVMGRGIAQICAQAGLQTIIYDPFEQALEKSQELLSETLEMLKRRQKIPSAQAVLDNLSFTTDLENISHAQLIIEAVPEKLDIKLNLLSALAEAAPEAILASNTSTFSISRLAAHMPNPSQVIGMHFFNPAPLMRLVEVIPGRETAPEVTAYIVALAEKLGKHAVVVRDAPGFIVNRVARPFYGEALRLHGEGVAPEVIDQVMRGLGFRMGPFDLMDLIGIDTNLSSTMSVYEAFFHEPRYRPHPVQKQLVDAGYLGRKSGQGFYTHPYTPPELPLAPKQPSQLKALFRGPDDLVELFKQVLPHTHSPAEAALVIELSWDDFNLEQSLHEILTDSVQDTPPHQHDDLDYQALYTSLSAELEIGEVLRDIPTLTLVWGRSASALISDQAQQAGFSLLPPFGETSVVELLTPLGQQGNIATDIAKRYFQAAGFRCLEVPDHAGGIGFRILAMLINEAVSAVAEQLATPRAIDEAMRLGVNYPRGILSWSELIGLPHVLSALQGLYEELGDDRYRPHPLLRKMVLAGLTRWEQL